MLRDGAPSFQAAAWWLWPFIFDFFFFGTGIARSAFGTAPALWQASNQRL